MTNNAVRVRTATGWQDIALQGPPGPPGPAGPQGPVGEVIANVKSYGAAGDGAADDTAAIKAAYDALPAAGGTLLFPPGTYSCGNAASPLGILTKTVHLLGLGRATTTLKNRGTNAQHFIWLKGSGSSVRGLTIDAMRSAQSANAGDALEFTGTGAVEPVTPTRDILVEGCEIKGNGFGCLGMWAIHGAVIRDNIIRDVFDSGIQLVEGSRDIEVTGNTVYCNGRFGIGTDTQTPAHYLPVSRISIHGNTVKMEPSPDTQYGILIQRTLDNHVTNNKVDITAAGTAGIRFDLSCRRATCSNNTIAGGNPASYAAIQVDGTGVQHKQVAITNNTIRDMTVANTHGIRIDNAIGVAIRHNMLDNCQRGINLDSSNTSPMSAVEVGGNVLRDCDIGVRFGGATGTGAVKLDKNYFLGTFSYRYASDPGFAITLGTEDDLMTGSYFDGATKILAPRAREGGNAPVQGIATLAAGTVTVFSTQTAANSRIFLTCQTPGGTPGFLRVSARTAGTSFTILSSSGTDTSAVAWKIYEAA